MGTQREMNGILNGLKELSKVPILLNFLKMNLKLDESVVFTDFLNQIGKIEN